MALTKPILLLLSSLLALQSLSNEIVDFSYSDLVPSEGEQRHSFSQITIKASISGINDYEFPQICYLYDKLTEIDHHSELSHSASNDYDSLQISKSKMHQLLVISEEIERTKARLQDMSHSVKIESSFTRNFDGDLETLERVERSLKFLVGQIENKTADLNKQTQNSREIESNNFDKTHINFQIESLQLKIKYLQQLLGKIGRSEDQNSQQQNLDGIFSQIQQKFSAQFHLIDQKISMSSYTNELSKLDNLIKSYNSNLEGFEIEIQYKKDHYEKTRENSLERGRSKNILAIIKTLKELKQKNRVLKEKNKQLDNHQYCKGVRVNVINSVKDQLKTVNTAYYEKETLDGVYKEQASIELKLKEVIEMRKKLLEEQQNKDDPDAQITKKKQEIRELLNKIRSIKFSGHRYSRTQIEDLIKASKRQLDHALEKRRHLYSRTPDRRDPPNYKNITSLVKEIKEAKLKYCQQHKKYQELSNKIWRQVYSYESKIKISSTMRENRVKQMTKLRQLQRNFESLRTQIIYILEGQ